VTPDCLDITDPGFDLDLALVLAQGVVHGLNALFGVPPPDPGGCVFAAQKVVLQGVVRKCGRMLASLAAVPKVLPGTAALEQLLGRNCTTAAKLIAVDVDLIYPSAQVDPLPDVPEESRKILGEPSLLFPFDSSRKLDRFARPKGDDYLEYVKLVVRELQAGKVELMSSIVAGGTVFAVGKSSGRLREVWNGTLLSEAAARPPKPPCLVSPDALSDLEASCKRPLLLSKRDAQAYFDQLMVPSCLRSYFGRPHIFVSELLSAGLSFKCIEKHFVGSDLLSPGCKVYPVSRCWPMGFSWSSYIAQSVLLARCGEAGLSSSISLCIDHPAPLNMSESFGLATDDVFHFTRRGSDAAHERMRRLDIAMANGGVVRNKAKDVTAVSQGTIIGIDFLAGQRLAPNAAKLCLVMMGVCQSISVDLSPLDVSALLGHIQWFFLLSRSAFSALDSAYAFARLAEPSVPRTVPAEVRAELFLCLMLLPLVGADLTREWAPIITASDASTKYGYGACVAKCSTTHARRIGRLAERRGDFVRLDRLGHDEDEAPRDRIGSPHQLGLAKSAFTTVVQAKKQYAAHSGELEAVGLVLLVKWILRSTARHSKRIVVLVDAKSVLGAASRGRSSAPSLKRVIRQLGALTLAGDFLLRYVYVPSEDNPADAPSRGVTRNCPRQQRLRQRPFPNRPRAKNREGQDEIARLQHMQDMLIGERPDLASLFMED
jgi:hypothetical protein